MSATPLPPADKDTKEVKTTPFTFTFSFETKEEKGKTPSSHETTVAVGGREENEQDRKLLTAVEAKNVALVRELLKDPKTNVNCVDLHTGETPLHIAVKQNNREMVALLLDKGAKTFLTNPLGGFQAPLAKAHLELAASKSTAINTTTVSATSEERTHSSVMYQLLRGRTSVTEDDLRAMVDFCLEFYMLNKEGVTGRDLLDYAVSCLTGVNVADLLGGNDNRRRYLSHLESIAGEVKSDKKGAVPEKMEGWRWEEFLPLRIRAFFEILIQVQIMDVEKEGTVTALPSIAGNPEASRTKLVEKLRTEILTELEALHIRQGVVAIRSPFIMPAGKVLGYHALACSVAKRLHTLKEKEEYMIACGWEEHAVYVGFMQQGDEIIVRVDNLGAGSEATYQRSGNFVMLKSGSGETTSQLLPPPKLTTLPINLTSLHLKPHPKRDACYPHLVGAVQPAVFDPEADSVPYIEALLETNGEYRPNKLDALLKIYNFKGGFTPKDTKPTFQELKWPVSSLQTVGNCVVENSQPGLRIRLGDEIERWLSEKERAWVVGAARGVETKVTATRKSTVESPASFYWRRHRQPRQFPERLREVFKQHYREHAKIRLLLEGRELPLTSSYINLAILEEEKQREKEQDLKDSRREKGGRSSLLGTAETLHAIKKSIRAEEILTHCKNPRQQQVLILGRAGIGKSTFCQYALHQWATQALWADFKWVFRIPLRHLNSDRYPAGRIYSEEDLVSKECCPPGAIPGWAAEKFRYSLTNDKILWLLDGYDERPATLPPSLQAVWERLIAQPHVIITSRPHMASVLSTKMPHAVRLEIVGFTDENIRAYTERFFASLLPSSAEVKPSTSSSFPPPKNKAEALCAFLQSNPNIWGIAHIPIQLELICSLWQQDAEAMLKTQAFAMSALYHKILMWLLKRSLQKYGFVDRHLTEGWFVRHLSFELQALEKLAYHLMQAERIVLTHAELETVVPEAKEEEVYQEILNVGVLKPMDSGEHGKPDYYFIHLTFQEFFAARYLAAGLNQPTGSEAFRRSSEAIATYKYDARFSWVFSFAAGLLSTDKNRTAAEHFWRTVEEAPRDSIGVRHLQLVIRCLEETQEGNQPSVYSRYLEMINRCLEINGPRERAGHGSAVYSQQLLPLLRQSPWVCRRTTLLPRLVTAFKVGLEAKGSMPSWVSQGLIDLKQTAAVPAVTEMLTAALYQEVMSQAPEVGVLRDITRTLKRLETPTVFTAELTAKLIAALQHTDAVIKRKGLEALVTLGDPLLNNPLVPKEVAAYLNAYSASLKGKEYKEKYKDEEYKEKYDEETRWVHHLLNRIANDARYSLKKRGLAVMVPPELITSLLNIILDGEYDEEFEWEHYNWLPMWDCGFAIDALVSILPEADKPAVVEKLMTVVRDKDRVVQEKEGAACALARLGNHSEEVINIIVDDEVYTTEEDGSVPVLSEFAAEMIMQTLSEIVDGALFDLPGVKRYLLYHLFEGWEGTRRYASYALCAVVKDRGHIPLPVLDRMRKAFDEPSEEREGDKRATLEALCELWRAFWRAFGKPVLPSDSLQIKDIIAMLIKALQEEDSLKAKALEVLIQMGPAAAFPPILERLMGLLSDEVPELRRQAVLALGKIYPSIGAFPLILERLTGLLNDDDLELQKAAALALGKVQLKAVSETWINFLGTASAGEEEARALAQLPVGPLVREYFEEGTALFPTGNLSLQAAVGGAAWMMTENSLVLYEGPDKILYSLTSPQQLAYLDALRKQCQGQARAWALPVAFAGGSGLLESKASNSSQSTSLSSQLESKLPLSEHKGITADVSASVAALLIAHSGIGIATVPQRSRILSSPLVSATQVTVEAKASQLLQHVANGEQKEAEALIKRKPELLLCKGSVTDLSKREFKGITAFQYAVWALDWHMWRMLLKYLDEKKAAQQWQEWDRQTFHPHGRHANWQGLIDAYTEYGPLYSACEAAAGWEGDIEHTAASSHWIRQIGGNQLLLPAHVVNEYCHRGRAFYPLPDFSSEVELTRSRRSQGMDWYAERCGREWAHRRGDSNGCSRWRYSPNEAIVRCDIEAVTQLLEVRQLQCEKLVKQLSESQLQVGQAVVEVSALETGGQGLSAGAIPSALAHTSQVPLSPAQVSPNPSANTTVITTTTSVTPAFDPASSLDFRPTTPTPVPVKTVTTTETEAKEVVQLLQQSGGGITG